MQRRFGLTIVLGLAALAVSACHDRAPAPPPCAETAPVTIYAGALPPSYDGVWYVPAPYADDVAAGGGGYYADDGSYYPDEPTSDDGSGSDSTNDPPASDPPATTDDSSSSSSSSSSDDGWDNPNPARVVQTQTVHPKTMPTEGVAPGCYACEIVCMNASTAVTTTGASAHSIPDACRAAERRLERAYAVTSCMNVQRTQQAERKISAAASSEDRIVHAP